MVNALYCVVACTDIKIYEDDTYVFLYYVYCYIYAVFYLVCCVHLDFECAHMPACLAFSGLVINSITAIAIGYAYVHT